MTSPNGNPILEAYAAGQSFWLDYIRRDLLETGELERLIESGEIRGVTSNPSIFQQAIGGSNLYDAAMRPLAHAGWDAEAVFESLAVHDIRAATDLFLPLYEGTGGRDGYVSIEVNPQLADDSEATLVEARRLWKMVNRPNLMVKIPATPAGIPAIERAIAEGININVTLIFALERYTEVMQAYLLGLERRVEDGLPLDRIASVASFFVSRVDTAVDRQLELTVREEGPNAARAAALLGRAAVANAKLAYAQFKSVFGEARFTELQERGARVQRPLWASTSTKNPAYSDVMYVEELIGPDTVNTVPPKTLSAFRDHGTAQPSLERNLSDARAQLVAIEGLGVSMPEVTSRLEQDGVQAFTDSYQSLLQIVESRIDGMRAELGPLQERLPEMLDQLDQERVASRYWRKDPTLWPEVGSDPVTDHEQVWRQLLPELDQQLSGFRALKPERIAWVSSRNLDTTGNDLQLLQVLSLDPTEQRMLESATPIESTFFVVASSYPEDPALEAVLQPIWDRASNRLGEQAAQHFLVLSGSGSSLSRLARQRQLPLVEGRVELSEAMLLAELGSRSAATLPEAASQMRFRCGPHATGGENPGLYLGAVLATAVRAGTGRLGLLSDSGQEPVVGWLADRFEASGLADRLALLRLAPSEAGEADRLIVYLRSSGELDEQIAAWVAAGIPCLQLDATAGLGGEAVRWEMGLGVAAHSLELEPKPLPEDRHAVRRFVEAIEREHKRGRLGWSKPGLASDQAAVWWPIAEPLKDAHDLLSDLAAKAANGLAAGSILNLALFRRSTHTLERTLDDLRRTLTAAGTDLRLVYGSLPINSGSGNARVRQLTLILSEAAKVDQPVPGREQTFGELQLLLARAMYEQLQTHPIEVGLIHFKPPETINNWLRLLIKATGQ